MWADIKVVFFVRVNQEKNDIIKVAQTIGCKRASDPETLKNLFEAKFSEALNPSSACSPQLFFASGSQQVKF